MLNTWEVELYKVIAENGKLNYDFIPTSLFRGCPRKFFYIYIFVRRKKAATTLSRNRHHFDFYALLYVSVLTSFGQWAIFRATEYVKAKHVLL